MQSEGVPSRRLSPVRSSAAAGANSRVTLQKHQQALKSCLDLCDSLGFHNEDASTSQSSTPQQACQLVDSATQFFAAQMEAASKEHADLFGRLLDPNVMKATAAKLAEAQSTLEFIRKNQERLVNFLQQPLPSLTIEDGGQAALLQLLQYASQDGQILAKGLEDFSWVMNFREPVSSWPKLLYPTPQAAVAAVQCHEGLAASLEALNKVGSHSIDRSQVKDQGPSSSRMNSSMHHGITC